MAPVKRLQELDDHVGKWVAVLDGHVVAEASTSRQLVKKVRELGPIGTNAIAQFVAPPTTSWMVGVG